MENVFYLFCMIMLILIYFRMEDQYGWIYFNVVFEFRHSCALWEFLPTLYLPCVYIGVCLFDSLLYSNVVEVELCIR